MQTTYDCLDDHWSLTAASTTDAPSPTSVGVATALRHLVTHTLRQLSAFSPAVVHARIHARVRSLGTGASLPLVDTVALLPPSSPLSADDALGVELDVVQVPRWPCRA